MFEEKVSEFVTILSSLSFDDAKKTYFTLSKKYHPDLNPGIDEDIFKALSNAWDRVKITLGDIYAKDNNKASTYSAWSNKMFDALMTAAIEISKISPDLEVSIMGYWLWVTGDTKTHKDRIKKVALIVPNQYGGTYSYHPKFHVTKQAWYVAGVKSGGTGRMSLEEIRATYGNVQVKYNEQGMTQ